MNKTKANQTPDYRIGETKDSALMTSHIRFIICVVSYLSRKLGNVFACVYAISTDYTQRHSSMYVTTYYTITHTPKESTNYT